VELLWLEAISALSIEAIAAVHRLFAGGLEGDLSGFSALGAGYVVHLAGAACATAPASHAASTAGGVFARIAAGFAANRLVLKPFFLIELLFSNGEGEIGSAVAAFDGFVDRGHGALFSFNFSRTCSDPKNLYQRCQCYPQFARGSPGYRENHPSRVTSFLKCITNKAPYGNLILISVLISVLIPVLALAEQT